MGEWRKVKLNDVADYSKDRISSDRLTINNYVSTENMLPEKAGKTVAASLPTGNVIKFTSEQTLVSNIRPYFRKIWYATNDGGCSADVLAFNITEQIDSKYFYYLLSQDAFFDYMMAGSKGTKMPRGDKQQIMQYPFLLPPLPEQKAIAETLSCLDDKIELNNKINANLEQTAQAIFKSWFVDFEPFQDGEFVESELGSIPKGWRVDRFENFIDFQEGPGIRNWQYVVENGTKFINIRCIQNNDLLIDTANMISNDEASGKYSHFLLNEWDVVVSTSGTLGRYAIVRKEHLPLCLNTSVIRFTPKSRFTDFSYMLSYLSSEEFYNHLLSKASGSVQANFGPMHLRQIELMVPPDDILLKYHEVVFPLTKSILQNRSENQKLANVRDSILPKLMSGEIDVSQV